MTSTKPAHRDTVEPLMRSLFSPGRIARIRTRDSANRLTVHDHVILRTVDQLGVSFVAYDELAEAEGHRILLRFLPWSNVAELLTDVDTEVSISGAAV